MADLKWYAEGTGDDGSRAAGLEPGELKWCKGPPGALRVSRSKDHTRLYQECVVPASLLMVDGEALPKEDHQQSSQ